MLLSRGGPDPTVLLRPQQAMMMFIADRKREREKTFVGGKGQRIFFLKKKNLLEVRRGQFRPWVTPCC